MFYFPNLNLICWKCRGLTNINTLNHVRKMIKINKPVIVCIMETRADEGRALKFCENFKHAWNWAAILAIGFS